MHPFSREKQITTVAAHLPQHNAPSLRDLFPRFVSFIDAKPKTVETYTKALNQFFRYLFSNGITNPKREDILAFREENKAKGHKPTTIQNYITAVRLFFKWLAQESLYPNVAEHIKGAKIGREHKKDYFTANQTRGLLESINRNTTQGLRDYALLTLMTMGGLRTIEVIRANVCDLRTLGDSTVLYIQGKGREEKTEYVKIAPRTEAAIRDYLKNRRTADAAEPLFTSQANRNKDKRLTVRSISRIAKNAFTANGFTSDKLSAHSLRHTAITLSLISGLDITETMQFARHSNIATTMIYNHALDKAKNRCSKTIEQAIFSG
jgi:integrase/recombinase XerD